MWCICIGGVCVKRYWYINGLTISIYGKKFTKGRVQKANVVILAGKHVKDFFAGAAMYGAYTVIYTTKSGSYDFAGKTKGLVYDLKKKGILYFRQKCICTRISTLT